MNITPEMPDIRPEIQDERNVSVGVKTLIVVNPDGLGKGGIDRFQARENKLSHLGRVYLVGNMLPQTQDIDPPYSDSCFRSQEMIISVTIPISLAIRGGSS